MKLVFAEKRLLTKLWTILVKNIDFCSEFQVITNEACFRRKTLINKVMDDFNKSIDFCLEFQLITNGACFR